MFESLKNIDRKEVDQPDTIFIRDIETRVFQGICMQVLSQIEGVALLEGGLIDALLGREQDKVKGIYVTQDQEKSSVEIRVEIRVGYGVCIPEKAEEVQTKLAEEVSRWSGLHVAAVHVVFKDLIPASLEMSSDPAEADVL